MVTYSCKNCLNLKVKVITKAELNQLSKYKINKALKKHDPDSLGLTFPFNLTVYKSVLRDGNCKIIYCSEHMFNRDLYIYRDNLVLDNLIPNKRIPCPKYK